MTARERWGEVELAAPPHRDQRCRLCGGQRRKGESDDGWVVDVRPLLERRDVQVQRHDDGTESGVAPEPPWSRRHVACEPVLAAVLTAAAGVPVDGLTERALRAVQADAAVPLVAEAADYTGGRPYGWLDDPARGRLRAAIEHARLLLLPRADPNGRRCTLCGAGRSAAWTRVPGWPWRDKVPGYACTGCTAACGGVIDPAGHPERVRVAALAEAADMAPAAMLQPVADRWRACSEVVPATAYSAPDAEPWGYAKEAVTVLVREAQERLPAAIRDPRRAALAAARLRQRHQHAAQAQAAQRARDEPERRLW